MPIIAGRSVSVRGLGFQGAGKPNQVTGLTATNVGSGRAFNNGRIDLAWSAPANNGAPITGYFIERSTNSGSTWSTLVANTGNTNVSYSDTSLLSAQRYDYRVSAINAVGTGDVSAAANATATTVPQAPTIGTATAGSGSASVTFTANATGGSAITGYTVTSSPGSLTGTGAASPITVSGLTNGTSYTFTATATNANGTSTASAASNSITPFPYFRLSTTTNNPTTPKMFIRKHIAPSGPGNNSVMFWDSYSQGVNQAVASTVNSSGSISSSKWIGAIGDMWAIYDVDTDSGGNYWLAGVGAGEPGGYGYHLHKINSSTVWQNGRRFVDSTNTTFNFAHGLDIDSSNNLYISGSSYGTTNISTFLKLDSTGNSITWQRKINFQWGWTSIAVDSSGNVFGAGTQGSYRGWLGKWNSSGTLQWQRQLYDGVNAGASLLQDVKLDSAGNVYVTGYSNASDFTFAKYNTSGVLQWQRQIGINNATIVIDSSDNIYICGNANTTVNIAKYNTSGTQIWGRQFAYTSSGNGYNARCRPYVTSDGSTLYISGWNEPNSGTSHGNTIKYPTDGSKTGSIAGGTVTSQNYDLGAGDWTDAAGTATESAGNMTRTALTGSDNSYTQVITNSISTF